MNYGLGKGVVWTCCCFLTPILNGLTVIRAVIGSSSNDNSNVNENCKKSNRLRLAKQWLGMCLTYFCTFFLPSTKMWKCLISRLWRTWTQDHDLLFLFLNFDLSSTPEKIANIWWTERDGISAIRFEAVRLDCLSDIFIAVAIIVT